MQVSDSGVQELSHFADLIMKQTLILLGVYYMLVPEPGETLEIQR